MAMMMMMMIIIIMMMMMMIIMMMMMIIIIIIIMCDSCGFSAVLFGLCPVIVSVDYYYYYYYYYYLPYTECPISTTCHLITYFHDITI